MAHPLTAILSRAYRPDNNIIMWPMINVSDWRARIGMRGGHGPLRGERICLIPPGRPLLVRAPAAPCRGK